MSRGIQAFKQTDLTKAIKGARNAGLDVLRFEVDRAGKIVIIAGKAATMTQGDTAAALPENEWDAVE
jgi:hypothetical protein